MSTKTVVARQLCVSQKKVLPLDALQVSFLTLHTV